MANTYKKVYIHLVFSVEHREALLGHQWRDEVFSYISGILKERKHFPLAVGGYSDHIHILFDYNLLELIPDLVREIKKASNIFIEEKKFSKYKFNWQSGYGVFSVGWKEKEQMINYIMNQEKHHKHKSFKKEYMSLLKSFNIEFSDTYVFEFFD